MLTQARSNVSLSQEVIVMMERSGQTHVGRQNRLDLLMFEK